MNVDDDLDEHLLRQFSCLGTTDKDELVKQLQKLLPGRQLNESTASFFLDMHDWNLQEAICSYLDYESPESPCMHVICDTTIGEGESIQPSTKFRKSWIIQNNGTETWPSGICLQHIRGELMGECTRFSVPCLSPKEIREISVVLTSPPYSGIYKSVWRMVTSSGVYFGNIVSVTVTVNECGTLAVTQQLHQLSTSQSNDMEMC